MDPRRHRHFKAVLEAIRALPGPIDDPLQDERSAGFIVAAGIYVERPSAAASAPALRTTTPARLRRQLEEVRDRALKLEDALSRGGQTKRAREQLADLLANAGPSVRSAIERVLPFKIEKAGEAWPQPLPGDIISRLEDGTVIPIELGWWAELARRALDALDAPATDADGMQAAGFDTVGIDVANVLRIGDFAEQPIPTVGGNRRGNAQLQRLAGAVARAYRLRTGRIPTLSVDPAKDYEDRESGAYITFAKQILGMFEIPRAVHYARLAAAAEREK